MDLDINEFISLNKETLDELLQSMIEYYNNYSSALPEAIMFYNYDYIITEYKIVVGDVKEVGKQYLMKGETLDNTFYITDLAINEDGRVNFCFRTPYPDYEFEFVKALDGFFTCLT